MNGKKLLSIVLVCSMLVSQSMTEAFAEEGTENMHADMETGMLLETEKETIGTMEPVETLPAEEEQEEKTEMIGETELLNSV